MEQISAIQELGMIVRARYPIIAVQSFEEERVIDAVAALAASSDKKVLVWSCTLGIREYDHTNGSYRVFDNSDKVVQPIAAINYIGAFQENGIFILEDFQDFIDATPVIQRALKDLAREIRKSKKTVILVGHYIKIPNSLLKCISLMDFPLPDKEVMKENLDVMINRMGRRPDVHVRLDDVEKEKLVDAAMGLTISEARGAVAYAVVRTGEINTESIDIIAREKRQIVKKSGILEFFEADVGLSDLGGMGNLKQYIEDRSGWWMSDVKEFGLSYLKGIVLIGIPGTGKSLAAKIVSSAWNLPLLRLDVGRVFDKFVGNSEENIRNALMTAESISPVVLWLDEVEKGMATGSGDNGTSRRVLGHFLTWMQEKTKPVYVICTANKVVGEGGLPPEFLRKGRFDELFFVDLPNVNEIKEIYEIHIGKRERTMESEILDRVAEKSMGYSGAEIEAAVEASLWKAFRGDKNLTEELLVESVQETMPLSETMKQDLERTKNWAKGHVRFASAPLEIVDKAEEEDGINNIEVE